MMKGMDEVRRKHELLSLSPSWNWMEAVSSSNKKAFLLCFVKPEQLHAVAQHDNHLMPLMSHTIFIFAPFRSHFALL